MARSTKLTRDARISREVARIRRALQEVPASKRGPVTGLIHRAAFLRIELEDLEVDINEHGATEEYQPGPNTPAMTRIRAAAQHYDKMVRAYTTVCKQLADLVPAGSSGAGSGGKKDAFQKLLESKQEGRLRRVK